MPIRLLLVDDHPIVLQGLQRLFDSLPDVEVVATRTDGGQAVEAVRTLGPDVLILDMRLPGRTGLEVLQDLKAAQLSCRTVLLTAAIREREVAEAVRHGAMGIVLKDSAPEALIECVRRVHSGEQWFDRDTVSKAFGSVLRRDAALQEASERLTPRELEIVRMVAQGLRNKVIAERLFISEGTVKIHLHNIYEKLGVDGRLELVLYAQEKEIL